MVILIPGTHGNLEPYAARQWWSQTSPNAAMLRRAGHRVVSFPWSTRLDGLLSKNSTWLSAGKRLFDTAPEGAHIIAHSHGGAVVAYAAAHGARFGTVVTLGTPPRSDVPYRELTASCSRWVHIAGDYRDMWAVLGSAGDGIFNWFRRDMPHAHKNTRWRCNHTELCEVETWDRNKLIEIFYME